MTPKRQDFPHFLAPAPSLANEHYGTTLGYLLLNNRDRAGIRFRAAWSGTVQTKLICVSFLNASGLCMSFSLVRFLKGACGAFSIRGAYG
jgi:hypothetical protein